MKNFVEDMIKAQIAVASLKPTYCGEISYKMRKGVEDILETVDSHYTVDGTLAIVKDKRDGQEYTIEIKPLKRGK